MSSDLFTSDSLFSDLTDDALNMNNPFDFLNPPDNLQNNDQQMEKVIEGPGPVFLNTPVQSPTNSNDPPKANSPISDLLDNAPPSQPKIAPVPKDVTIKVTQHQIRNIQPKPDISSYRIVAVTDVNNISKSQSPQAVKIHSTAPSTMEKSRNPVETVVKKVVPVTDLRLVNSGNEKQVQCEIAN